LQATLVAQELKKSKRGNERNDDQALQAKFKNRGTKKEKLKKH
jgi:hypothetical protein